MNWKFDQQSICGQVARQKAAFLNIELWIVRYRSITTYKTQIGKSISIGLMEYSEYGKQGLDWLMGDITWHAHIDIVAWTNNSSHTLEIKWGVHLILRKHLLEVSLIKKLNISIKKVDEFGHTFISHEISVVTLIKWAGHQNSYQLYSSILMSTS